MKKDSPFQVMYVSDVEKTFEFYSKLDAEIVEKEHDKVTINLGGTEVHFVLDSTEPFEEYKFMTEKKDRGNGLLIYVEVKDINEFYRNLADRSIAVLTDIKENHWDNKEFLIADPDGYKIAFWGK